MFGAEKAVFQGFRKVLGSALLATTALAAGAIVAPTLAQAQEARSYDIPAGPLAVALNRFGEAANVEIIYDSALTNGLSSPGLKGSFSTAEALSRLLAGTGLAFRQNGTRAFTLERAPQSADGAIQLGPVRVEGDGSSGSSGYVSVTGDPAATERTGSYAPTGALTTATPLGLTLRETPQSVSVITNQRMEDQALLTIQQVLAQVPGVQTGSMGTELSGANSRGYSFSNYQYDGVNSFVELLGGTGVPSQTLADMAVYDRIEVLRGASGLVTGAGDPSGTINMVRKKPTSEYQGSVEASIGRWNDIRGVLDLSGPLNKSRSIRGRLVVTGQDADSYIDNYGRKKGLIYGVIEADLTSTTRLTAGVEYERQKVRGQGGYTGFPLWYSDGTRTDLPRSFSAASRDNRLDLESTKAFVTLEQQLGEDWKLKLSGNHWRSSQDEDRVFLLFDSYYPDTNGDGTLLHAGRRVGHTKFSNVDLNVRGPFTLFGRDHELVLGGAYEDYDHSMIQHGDTSGLSYSAANLFSWDRTGSGIYGPATVWSGVKMWQASIYAATRLQVSDRLKLIAGTRIFWRDYKLTDLWATGTYTSQTSEKGVWTPYGGLVYDIDTIHSVYASYATIYKPQTARDRNGDVLDPIEGANFEIGVKSAWLGGRLNTAVALYHLRQDNVAETDAGYIVPGTTDTVASKPIKGAKTQGIDVEVTGAISPDWNISASWTYGKTDDADGERITTTFPKHIAKIWTAYRLPGDFRGLTIGGGVNWYSKTYSTYSPWWIGMDLYWEQKPYAVANMMLRYDISEQLSATINVSNVFDKKYIASVSDFWNSGNYGEPRNFRASVRYKF